MAVAGKYFSLHKHSDIDQFLHTDYLDFFGIEVKIEYIYVNSKWRIHDGGRFQFLLQR